MPVDTTHPEYDSTIETWTEVRDVIEGWRKIKEGGRKYLPSLLEQDDRAYNSYKKKALFFEITGRTVDGLHGMIFKKDPEITFPETLKPFVDDCTMTGKQFYDYAKDVVREVIGLGRGGTLIDYDGLSENRAYLSFYKAENIINWKVSRIGGRMVLTTLVLMEYSDQYVDVGDAKMPDEYEHCSYEQYRVFKLTSDYGGVEGGEENLYVTYEIYRRKMQTQSSKAKSASGNSSTFVLIDSGRLERKKQPLTSIPFVFHGSKGSDPCVGKVPMEGIANINISHYITTADLENALHITGTPTAVACGFTNKEEAKMAIGSDYAWTTENPNAKAFYLEYTGQGVTPLLSALEKKQEMMSILGARLTEPQKKDAESAETHKIRQSGEASALMDIATSCTQSLSKVLQWVGWWEGNADDPSDLADEFYIELNTDFISQAMTADDLRAITEVWKQGGISYDTYHWNLRRGEVIPPGKDNEQEREEIMSEPPMIPPSDPMLSDVSQQDVTMQS